VLNTYLNNTYLNIVIGCFRAETASLGIESQPDATEILVEGVKFLRFAESNGTYHEGLRLLRGGHSRSASSRNSSGTVSNSDILTEV
jgi:hypothetical protein